MKKTKNKIDEGQIWFLAMLVVPVVVLTALTNQISDLPGGSILWAGISGAIGGGLGAGLYHLTKTQSRGVKGAILLGFFLIVSLIGRWLFADSDSLNPNDWQTQKIGLVEFASPVSLQLQTDAVPSEVDQFYRKLQIYTDGNNERSTSCIYAVLQNESINLGLAYRGALEGILRNIRVDIDRVQFDTLLNLETELATTFSFSANDQVLQGYGYVLHADSVLQSFWLMPLQKGFSDAYLAAFEKARQTDHLP